jgi:putative membrane protein
MIFFLGLFAIFILGTGLLIAQVNRHMDGYDDSAFLQRYSLAVIWNIETSKVAGNKASALEVREFGQHMARRYSDVNKELVGLAAAKNITIFVRLDAVSENTLAYMSGQRGAEIDREYTSMAADDLSANIRTLRSAVLYTQDADIRTFAEKTLSKMEEDLLRINTILRGLPLPVLK